MIDNNDDKDRCMKAYNYFIKSKESSYKELVVLHEKIVKLKSTINIFDMNET